MSRLTAPTLNASQEAALDLSRHLVVTASAGSGKTTVLVERFVRILEANQQQPGEIVAITFTEEAAAQMRRRIGRRLYQREREADSSSRGSWRRCRQALSLAAITTFHGFCYSLLQRYPLQAGIGAGWQVPSRGDQLRLRQESVASTLRNLASAQDSALAGLLEYLSLAAVEALAEEIVCRRNDPWARIQDLGLLKKCYRQETASHLRSLGEVQQLRRALALIPDSLFREGGSMARRCRQQQALFARSAEMTDPEWIAALKASLAKRWVPAGRWRKSAISEELGLIWKDLRQYFGKYPLEVGQASTVADRHYETALATLNQLRDRLGRDYRKRKEQLGIVDFEDLLTGAWRLLQQTDIRARLRQRYRYFLVDEFQDTNSLQWQILLALLGPESNLMAVGDTQQSIYRFRGADVSVFRQVQRWVESRGRRLEMPENYRSLPSLVSFCNRVFACLFKGGTAYQAQHQAMWACLPAAPGRAVQAYFFDEGELAVDEPQLTAAWVNQLLTKGGRAPGEIAILLRARTRLRHYEAALEGFEIPYQSVGGSDFFQYQEVLDCLNLLRFLANPSHDLALVGLLRSPFFNVSDEELFLLSQQPGDTYLCKLRALGPLSNRLSALKFARNCLQRWRRRRNLLAATVQLQRALGETGYPAILEAMPGPDLKKSHVQRMIGLVRDLERETSSLGQLVERLESLTQSGWNMAEKGAQSDKVVRIYTIHGAKGLQFPVVFLPELGTPFSWGPQDRICCEKLHGDSKSRVFVGFKIWNPDREYSELIHPVYRMLRRLDEYRQLAEEKRLLYVAATRAQQQLFLLGRRTRSFSYSRWLIEAGAEDYAVDADDLPRSSAANNFRWPPPAPTAPMSRWNLFTEPISSPTQHFHWSTTEIARFSVCPRRLHLSREEVEPEEQQTARSLAAWLGSAVHHLLEDHTLCRRPAELSRAVKNWARQLEALFPEQQGRVAPLLQSHLQTFYSSSLWRRLQTATDVKSEQEFSLGRGRHLISGVVDKLFRDSDNRWWVVDFKTGAPPKSAPHSIARRREAKRQLEVYLWGLTEVLGVPDLKGLLFYTADGQTWPLEYSPELGRQWQARVGRLPLFREEADFPKTRDPSNCTRCGFLERRLCPGLTPSPAPARLSVK